LRGQWAHPFGYGRHQQKRGVGKYGRWKRVVEVVDLCGTHNDQTYQLGSRRVIVGVGFLKYIVVKKNTPKIGEIRSF